MIFALMLHKFQHIGMIFAGVSEKGLQDRHSGLDPESSVFRLGFRFRGNDKSQIIVKLLL